MNIIISDLKKAVIPFFMANRRAPLTLKLTVNKLVDSIWTTIGIYKIKLHDKDLKVKIWNKIDRQIFKSILLHS